MYLANITRPDIAFAVNLLARKQSNATIENWIDVKRIMRYLRGSSDLGLTYRGVTENLEIFTDASFRDNADSSSTSGMVARLFGDSIMWRSHKQTVINLSTCHAEYYAMSEACQEMISLDKALRDILGIIMYPIIIRCDNKFSISCTQKEGNHKLKNFDDSIDEIIINLENREKTGIKNKLSKVHGDYIKQCVTEGKVKLIWIPSKENLADIFTKLLPFDSFRALRDNIFNYCICSI
ncbi:uncharacterized protein LOC131675217 [Phymastichus coffea]|uniref:uncharacterized protein LOC131675217 n=1 Tax=Phymastichus coffea TaxID=108790 RepID=UPI00273C8522|nr:uncharacterized protein LOC131675217 [Phymastichus coffea]